MPQVNVGQIVEIVSYTVSAASAIAAIFPKAEKAGRILGGIRKVVDILAFNFGNARNERANAKAFDFEDEASR